MTAHDNDSFFSVSISPDDVRAFKASWPCSGIPAVRIRAQFDKRNGDLVDLEPHNLEERGANGSALIALLSDAQSYAADRLNLPAECHPLT